MLKLSNYGDFFLSYRTLPLFYRKICILFVLNLMRASPRLLVSPYTTTGLASAVVFAIAIILLPSNITVTNAQQQEQQPPPISQPPAEVTQNGATTSFQSTIDGLRLNVPEGWAIHDVNNTGSTRSEETRQGYGILAQLCPQEQQQQEQQQAASSNASRSRDTASCQGSEGDIIHIVRYPDLDVRLQEVSSNITADNNMTIDNILLYHMQKLEEVGYSRIQIVNSTDTTLNVTNAQTNQIIATVPARLVEVTYSTASAPNVIREGYFMLTATDETRPSIGMTKGYSIFYEGTSIAAGAATTPATIQQTTTSTPFVGLPPRQTLPVAVQQIFGSFELIVAPEVAQDTSPAQSEQVQEVVEEEPTNPLTVDITSSDTEGEVAIAPATFEFQADIAGGTEPYTYRWDFDDDGTSSRESDDDVVDHTFEEAGSYDVSLTVTDSGGQSASDSMEITVEKALAKEPVATEEEEAPPPPPTIIELPAQGEEDEQPIIAEQPLTVDITSSDTEGRETLVAPATFEFEAHVVGGTEPYTISWNFDDGTSSRESDDDETISHTFEEPGRYDVGATVTDSSGQRAADTIRITVEKAPPPPPVIRQLAEQGEDAISNNNLHPQQQQQRDAASPTGITEEILAEQLTAGEVKPDLSDAYNNLVSDDLIDVDKFIDDLFDRLGLND
jgi:PKD repeat protein